MTELDCTCPSVYRQCEECDLPNLSASQEMDGAQAHAWQGARGTWEMTAVGDVMKDARVGWVPCRAAMPSATACGGWRDARGARLLARSPLPGLGHQWMGSRQNLGLDNARPGVLESRYSRHLQSVPTGIPPQFATRGLARHHARPGNSRRPLCASHVPRLPIGTTASNRLAGVPRRVRLSDCRASRVVWGMPLGYTARDGS